MRINISSYNKKEIPLGNIPIIEKEAHFYIPERYNINADSCELKNLSIL